MKLLVVNTGGTISSIINNEVITLNDDFNILEYLENKYCNIEFELICPYYIHSENLNAKYINLLCDTIRSINVNNYQGIIILHGTDTLQYTSCALNYLLKSIDIPIVFVSSNYVLNDKRANGIHNLNGAIDFITNKHLSGVYISYKNGDGNTKIISPTYVLPHRNFSDELYCLDSNKLCPIEIDSTVEYLVDDSKVLIINSYPGCSYNYELDNVNNVLINGYHSGTLDVQNPHLLNMLSQCKEKNIKVYLLNANNECDYESSKIFGNYSILPLVNISPIDAYIRLWINNSKI